MSYNYNFVHISSVYLYAVLVGIRRVIIVVLMPKPGTFRILQGRQSETGEIYLLVNSIKVIQKSVRAIFTMGVYWENLHLLSNPVEIVPQSWSKTLK